eukprot:10003766-Lingulodinium_polyedra.AAC.1
MRGIRTKGPKLALSRWMGWMHCFSYWEKCNGVRLLTWLYLGISLGYLNHQPASATLNLKPLTAFGAGDRKESTQQSAQAGVRAVRDQCKNLLHVATLVLADSELERRGRMVHKLAEGI